MPDPVITLSVDADAALKQMRIIAGDQFPFAIARGLTELAKLGQIAVQVKTRQTFKLHGEFIPKGIRIRPAKKTDVKSTGIGTSAVFTAPKISGFMPGHETGEVRSPFAGGANDRGKFIAIPGRDLKTKAFKTGSGRVRKRWRPAELLKNYDRVGRGHGAKVQQVSRGGRKGKPFIIHGRNSGVPMIVRRRGKSQFPLELLYIFSERATIKPVWDFEERVQETVEGLYIPVLEMSITQAMLTAGAKKS